MHQQFVPFSGKNVSHTIGLQKEIILEKWKEKICAQIPAANEQTLSELRNSIPRFLDRLIHALASDNPRAVELEEINDVSAHHGVQRSTLEEYSLHEMLSEYRLLREAIFEVLEVNEPLDNRARNLILESIEQGMVEAANVFVKAAEKRNKYQKQETQNILNSIKDYAVIMTDITGKITDWNDGAQKIFGYKREEVLGLKTSFIFSDDDQKQDVPLQRMAVAANEGKAEEKRWLVKKNGEKFFAAGVLSPLYNEAHYHIGFIKVFRDETELKTVISQLRIKTAEFEAIFHSIPDAVVVAGKDHRILGYNEAVKKMFGYDQKELIGHPTSIFYADQAEYEAQSQDKHKSSPDDTVRYLVHYKKKTGEIFISETNRTILRDDDGDVRGFLSIMRDTTERVKTEEAVKHLANAMPQIVWTADANGVIDYFNGMLMEFTGIDFSELVGNGWYTVLHPDDLDEVQALWQQSIATGLEFEKEFRIRRRDGEYQWHLGRAIPIYGEDGKIMKWYGTNTEIHDQKLSYDRLLEERELRERFVSTLSHDLRTPLTAAKLGGQVIRRSYSDNEKLMKSIERVLGGIDRVDSMIQDLLDANRISAGEQLPIKASDCEIVSVIHATVDDLRHIHGDRFIVDGPAAIEGYWDCSGVRRILENLCNNAIKYGSSEDLIQIKINPPKNDAVTIVVHNEGKPIPDEEQKTLFLPYKRANAAELSGKRGWGIGLTLVKGLVSAHHGKVSVESSALTGTNFTVCLPLDFRSLT